MHDLLSALEKIECIILKSFAGITVVHDVTCNLICVCFKCVKLCVGHVRIISVQIVYIAMICSSNS